MGEPQTASPTPAMSWRVSIRRLLYVLYSVVVGAIMTTSTMWRLMHGFGSDWIDGIAIGSALGGMAGLLLSPFFMGLLYRKNAIHVLGAVVAPMLCVGLISDELMTVMVLTLLCFVVATVAANLLLPDLISLGAAQVRACNRCGYDLSGIPNQERCPECGWCFDADAGPLDRDHPCSQCGYRNENPYVAQCPECGALRSNQMSRMEPSGVASE
ncbi:MAG: hypothetical protein H6813_00925 [Phycisphaeraceae bacterium]|nr:hypothetical protein [Phycisphaeraceae bacterium]MCB9847351.1 hypothetical protein [Phycisphaeraceae bacterium]